MVRLIWKKIFFWVLALGVFTWGTSQYWPVTVHIRGTIPEEDFSIRMPLKDKKRLEYFFRNICFLNAWAYTLIGSKPMSIHQYRKPWSAVQYFIHHRELKGILLYCFWPPRFREICWLFNPEQLKIKLGWEALNKYIPYFPNSRFALYESDVFNDEIIGLSLVDKIKFIKIVKQHLDDFEKVLQNQEIEPKELFDNRKLRLFIKGLTHDGHLGTILGFGRDNAWLYYKYREMNLKEWPMISPWLEEQDAQLERLNEKDISFQPWDISDLFYPPFACDPNSEETKQLKRTYREERDKIVKYYEGKDVVEATLSLFNQK